MEDLGKNIFKYDKVEFLPAVMEKKNDGYRLGQACCAFADDIFHVSYSFCKGQELVHFRLSKHALGKGNSHFLLSFVQLVPMTQSVSFFSRENIRSLLIHVEQVAYVNAQASAKLINS